MNSKITLDDLKYAIEHFPYTVKEQMELDKYNEIIEVQDEN
jgi:hypothetical protein